VDRGCLEHSKNIRPSHQGKVFDCLSRYQCNQLEAGVDNHFSQHACGDDLQNKAAQVIAGAALFGAAFLEGDVLASDTNIKIHVIASGVGRRQPAGADLQKGDSSVTPYYTAGNNRFHSNRGRDFPMLRPCEHFLRRTGL